MIFLPAINSAISACRRGAGRALLAGGLVFGAAGPLRAGPVSAEAEGWQLLSGYLFGDAYNAFGRAPADSRSRALGLAASRLNHQPVTPGKVAEVEEQLHALIAVNGSDDAGIYARLLLARIAHLHRPAEVAEIEAAYRAVIVANRAHPVAQVAATKLALVLLYQRPDLSVPQRLAAAAELEAVAGAAALPETACGYYRALAGAALFYDVLDARVLAWLQHANELGTRDVLVASALRIQLAEVARALGRREEALAYYRRFLDSILPTDNRYLTAQERMEDLAKEGR